MGLQEAELIRIRAPGDAFQGNPVRASSVVYDYLQIPASELSRRIAAPRARQAGGGSRATLEGTASVEVVGETPEEQTPSGLWPSDHAGVIARFPLRRPPVTTGE